MTAEVAGRRFRLASPATAAVLGMLGLALIAAWVPLTYLTRDPQATRDGFAPAFALACGLLRKRDEPAGFSRVAGSVMSAAMHRANRKDLSKLRSILEAG